MEAYEPDNVEPDVTPEVNASELAQGSNFYQQQLKAHSIALFKKQTLSRHSQLLTHPATDNGKKSVLMAMAEEHQQRLATQAECDFTDTNRDEFLKKKKRYGW